MTESVQKWLNRNRPPRVKITYDVETGGAIEKRELPFVVGMFADLSGDRPNDFQASDYAVRTMENIDRDNFNAVMTKAQATISLGKIRLTLKDKEGDPESVESETSFLGGEIRFKSLDDFTPVAIVQAVPAMNALYRIRGNIRMLQAKAESSSTFAKALEPLTQINDAGKKARAPLAALAPPDRVGDAAVQLAARSDALTKAKQRLRTFAATFASAADDAARSAAAKTYGFDTTTKPWDAEPIRQFIGLFSLIDTPENRRMAQDQLNALASYAKPDADVDDTTKATRVATAKRLGLPDTMKAPDAKAVADEASALLRVLSTPLPPVPTKAQELALSDAQRAALVVLGVQEREDSALVQSRDPVTRNELSPAQLAEQKHAADSRWFANNLLLGDKAALPLDILALLNTTYPKNDDDRQRYLAPLGYFATDLLIPLDAPGAPGRKTMAATVLIDERVASIDKQLSKQLRTIMHWPKFQELEATWRGLFYVVSRAETGKMLKLHVFNATMVELLHDLNTAVDKDQSRLFKLIYEAGYGTLGGQPYSVLVGGYEVGKMADEIDFLTKMSEVAASAHAPFITAASPSLFNMEDFTGLDRPRDLQQIFESVDLVGFQEFRKSEDSRYVTLVLPHMLLRLPYGEKSQRADGLKFEESVDAGKHRDFLWGNAAYLLAERITHAYSLYSWTAAIRGVEGGGLIEGLPLYTYSIYPPDSDAKALFCPTEVSITDRREKELSDLGFISLCHCKGSGTAAFFGGQTTNQPKTYITDEANANAKLSALLPYMLSASRFAHYIKVIMRDKIGSFLTKGNVETYLNSWIAQYVLLDENAHQEAKASYPLSQAKVLVTDEPGSPGSYNAVIFLRPHFQLEELNTSIRLVASLPA